MCRSEAIIKANDCRLIAMVQYRDGVLMIRFFGSHEDYDKVDAETV
ncbi:type II toxin-antitoxin system HigB family toxin [Bradyrhizobium sp. 1050_B9_N1_2]